MNDSVSGRLRQECKTGNKVSAVDEPWGIRHPEVKLDGSLNSRAALNGHSDRGAEFTNSRSPVRCPLDAFL